MLLQTNSYIVPKDKRAEHARLLRRFRASLAKLGCDSFEVYEQVGANWTTGEPTGRYVQIMRFRDRRHQLAVQAAERVDPVAQAIIAEFCQLINFPYQQQQGLFAVGFYSSVLPVAPSRQQPGEAAAAGAAVAEPAAAEPPEEATVDAVGGDEEAEYQPVSDELEEAGAPEAEPAAEVEGESDDIAEPAPDEAVPDEEEINSKADAPEGDAEADAVAEETIPQEGDTGDADEPAEAVVEIDEDAAAEDAAAEDASPDDATAEGDDVDELGALLEAHLHTHPGGESGESDDDVAHPLAGPQGAADDVPEVLDTVDGADLNLPDESSPEPRHASNHFAR